MRSLIQPGLFWAARIGLFLAIVAWITGHWWVSSLQVPGGKAELNRHGFSLSKHPAYVDWYLDVVEAEEGGWEFTDWLFGYDVTLLTISSPFRNYAPPYRRRFFGITIAHAYSSDIIAVSHWLVVGICSLFYAALIFAYRKRSKTLPLSDR